ncbi:hypothetical protein BHF68_03045 [Desulfuribacillus alkaliarsenatis]|uniref:Cobalt transporter n=1 Tax=Desulfuribacillus alkaliarsenatis TaxID=766136 RepID=A0A1E5G6H6_9FIRM|nr:hypothetical protein BHF68_03045 [Desulfuribacillus alkaliarsenatis]
MKNIKDEKTDYIRVSPQLDSGLKFLIALIMSTIPFLLRDTYSFVILTVFLFVTTILLRIRPRTILTSFAAYSIIVLLPYMFGFFISTVIFWFSGNEVFAYHQQISDIALRMFQLFLLWYVGSLYFQSTSMKSFIGLLDKLLSPLKRLGVPISDHLKVIMCVVNELKVLGPEMKKQFSESMQSLKADKKSIFNINIKGISNIIISFLVNSFKRLDYIEEYLQQVETDELYEYQFQISKEDIWMLITFILLVYLLFIVETGYAFF